MGQKVNPKAFRIGINKTWDSRWIFSDKKQFKELLHEDIKIREGIMNKFSFGIITRVEIERAINKINIIIHAVKPGMIIGKGGKGLEDVKRFIVSIVTPAKVEKEKIKIDFKVEPVKKPFLNAYYVAQDISSKLVRGLPHRFVIHNTMNRVLENNAQGIKVQLAGRIAGTVIGRTEKYSQGKVPSSTIREDIDYAEIPALTRSGYVGVKVWIAK